jgi:hypothetical protein
MWQGRVISLHFTPEASAKMTGVPEVRAVPGWGLEGDRYYLGTGHWSARPSPGGREVTLIEMETVGRFSIRSSTPGASATGSSCRRQRRGGTSPRAMCH